MPSNYIAKYTLVNNAKTRPRSHFTRLAASAWLSWLVWDVVTVPLIVKKNKQNNNRWPTRCHNKRTSVKCWFGWLWQNRCQWKLTALANLSRNTWQEQKKTLTFLASKLKTKLISHREETKLWPKTWSASPYAEEQLRKPAQCWKANSQQPPVTSFPAETS